VQVSTFYPPSSSRANSIKGGILYIEYVLRSMTCHPEPVEGQQDK